MRRTEIYFNKQETDLMFSREIFPLKRRINEKIYILFEQIKQGLKDSPIHQKFSFPDDADVLAGKISQGENHQAYPWIMLDYPRLFKKERIFSFRTLFWYGSGFSNALLAGGACCENFAPQLIRNKNLLDGNEIYFSFTEEPWDHEVRGTESALIDEVSVEKIKTHIETHHYFKLSHAIASADAEIILQKSIENYTLLLDVLQ